MPSPDRWQPSRAGILNVYQYEDETLQFAGGRLLLRGVNGSGKSTAMSMLLPFLLEADTRRIDAAGEQTGVLKSWMLADTDQTQRTGYLWIEFSRPDPQAPGSRRHHTVGCGIRAGKHTDRVTIWWFSTPRRAKLDFALTERRIPLSADALRVELGEGAVFTSSADYRAEVARRFFGGNDPSGYLALLHQVRNPRIGDRIDTDLPQRLRAALPAVPEDAVADAAQPLEDLEDHRRNVTGLERTDRALAGLLDVYASYARRVIRVAADYTAQAVSVARSATQRRGRLRNAADAAAITERRLQERLLELEADHSRMSARLSGLKESPAYRQHATLVIRREHCASVQTQSDSLDAERTRARDRVDRAAARADKHHRRVTGDLNRIADAMSQLGRQGAAAAVTLPLPAAPVLGSRSLADDSSGTTVEQPPGLGLSGADRVGSEPGTDPLAAVKLALDPLGDALRARRAQVAAVTAALGVATESSLAHGRAETDAGLASTRATAARRQAAELRRAAQEAGDRHAAAVRDWATELGAQAAGVPAAEPDGPTGWLAPPTVADPGGGDVRAAAAGRVRAAEVAAAQLADALGPVVVTAALRVSQAADAEEAIRADLAAVQDRAELPLPRAGWQAGDPAPTAFASLVDFREEVTDSERAGLEAALQASGLLTAALYDDGRVVAASGELIVVAGDPVVSNLAAVLYPALPEGASLTAGAVNRVLDHVGLGPESAAPLWMAPDGRFGAGSLRGRYAKDAAEHVGAGARTAARQRRITELRAELLIAAARVADEEAVHTALRLHHTAVREVGARIPRPTEVDDAAADAAGAAGEAQRADARFGEAREAATEALRVAEAGWARAQTVAASAALPLDDAELGVIADAVEEGLTRWRALPGLLATGERSTADWRDSVSSWIAETETHSRAAAAAREAASRAERAAVELATLEGALGEEPGRVAEQVAQAQRSIHGLAEEVEVGRKGHTEAVRERAAARAVADGAEQVAQAADIDCRTARAALVQVCAIPGLLAAAQRPDAGSTELTAESDTVEGAARLVDGVRASVPPPERDVAEDTLNRSLRGIRDALGAGWDVEARRGGDGAPLAVEVSGPYGRRVLLDAAAQVGTDLSRARGLLSAQQDAALRNLLHGRVAREVALALFQAGELIRNMNAILGEVTTGQGIGVRLDWRTRGDLDGATGTALRLLEKDPGARTEAEDQAVGEAVTGLVEEARAADPEASYRTVIASVLDYRDWHELRLYLRRPGRADERLTRKSRLSEGEKKLVTYLPMAAAAAASATAHDPHGVGAPRLVLLDDAFAKVSEDNHGQLFGLLVGLALDFVVTSERLWGTHAAVPELAITEVLRDPDLRAIALVHYRWDGRRRTDVPA